jgi:ATP adenylyltransferase
MDYLWSPWRYRYITDPTRGQSCIFCERPGVNNDEESLIVYRGASNYIILNRYPYTSGHLMVTPYEHVARIQDAAPETLSEMILLTSRAASVLDRVYRPQGMNAGMNLGQCAGAGVAGHIHMHLLPRWVGDASFMTTVAETRVLPEELADTYRKIAAALRES